MGAAIAAGFGVLWAQWAAAGVAEAPSAVIVVVAIAAGLVILWQVASLWRSASGVSAHPSSKSMFSSRGYVVTVTVVVLTIAGGNALLGGAGYGEYVIAWVAAVTGAHFLAFGRLFRGGFTWLGTALVSAAAAGVLAGLAGGGTDAITATAGLIAATSLLAAGGCTVARARFGT